MKKARLLLPTFLFFVIPTVGQVQPAASPEQCRADSDSWGIPTASAMISGEDKFANLTGAIMHDRAVSSKRLEARIAEMQQCARTDLAQSARYAEASRAYAIADLGRIADFVRRHNLMAQFYREDGQGQR